MGPGERWLENAAPRAPGARRRARRAPLQSLALIAVFLSGARAQEAPRQDARPFDSLAREATLRGWARAPWAESAAISAALADRRWALQEVALEALRRALEAGTWDGDAGRGSTWAARAREIALEPRNSARARALELLAAWPQAPGFTPQECARVAAELILPAERLALVAYCGQRDAAEHAPLLLALSRDRDERVAGAAARTLLQAHGASEAARRFLASPLSWPRFAQCCEWLALARPGAALLEALQGCIERATDWTSEQRVAGAGLVEALRVLQGLPADAGVLAAGWEELPGTETRRLLLDAARAARLRLPELADLLLARSAAASEDGRFALEGALQAAEQGPLLARAARIEAPRMHSELWGLVLGREVDWKAGEVAPWLTPERDPQLRLQVVRTLSAAVDQPPGVVAEVLAGLLQDRESSVARLAFRALAAAEEARPWSPALHAAFQRMPLDEQVRNLPHLPRRVPLELFREDLLALAQRVPSARATAFDLLCREGGDARVEAELRAALEADVAAIAAGDPPRDVELRAAALARNLQRVAGERAVPVLAETADRAGPMSVELGKAVLSVLGQTEEGRERLAPWLREREHSRLRIEAGLQLAPFGEERALENLPLDFPRCDAELKLRTLRALAESGHERGAAFLRSVVGDPAVTTELRVLALELLSAAGQAGELLQDVALRTQELELAGAAMELLGRGGGSAGAQWLATRFAALEDPAFTRGLPDGVLDFLREAVLRGMALAGDLPPELSQAWLRLPLQAIERDQQARFLGERLPSPDFLWGGELALSAALAARGELLAHLDRAGPWWLLDGRLLAAMAGRTRSPREPRDPARQAVEATLLRAALIAFAGEAEGSARAALSFETRHRLLLLAEAAGDWSACELHASRLLSALAAGDVAGREVGAALGPFAPAAGRDPLARLECARLQARARAALRRGDLEAARAAASAAGERLGFSADARAAQRALLEEL